MNHIYSVEITKILPPKYKEPTTIITASTKSATITSDDLIAFKSLCAKEYQKLEIYMEL
jgi:hypothetical protein